ncbi:hypothetical protein [Intrasporangium calvum]|uniref:hypothetical protein n=1 Tax=Intrasporangium calvum TaxID=53358 RepID=UPI000DF5CC9A|nr:hypothetical protein [Intrasporangium calvum]AXG12510.1 hypothetical protein DN585_02855 [Intrasporangium calvum]
MRIKRGLAAFAVFATCAVASASAAQAWTWASSSSPIIMSGGGGYGNAVQLDYNDGRLESWLKDTVLDGERTYVHMYADYGSADFKRESGRRTDGGSSYARMEDKLFTTPYPYGIAQYLYTVRICRDKPWTDPCSDAYRQSRGL